MQKILFIPSDHGGGRGHVSRCLYLATQMRAQGFHPAIVLEKKHFNKVRKAGLQTYLLDTKWERLIKYQFAQPHKPGVRLLSKLTKSPVFLEFSGLEYQVPRDGYFSKKVTRYRMRQLEKIFNVFKPDMLIGDTHFLTFLLGNKYMVPVLQITRKAGFPPAPDFLWWKKENPELIKPEAFLPFSSLAAAAGLAETSTPFDLLKGDRYLIPASREMEPVTRKGESVFYLGPLAGIKQAEVLNDPFSEKNEYPRIYITIGGGAGRSGEKNLFEKILDIFNKSEFQVLVSTAGKVPAKLFENLSANVKFIDWVDGEAAINHCDLIIHHGGYATTMETLLAGKPAIIIPSHSEQEGNGRRLEKMGLGKTILPYNDTLTPLRYRWTYGEYTMRAAFSLHLPKDEILQSINTLLYSDVHQSLKKLSASLLRLQKRMSVKRLIDLN